MYTQILFFATVTCLYFAYVKQCTQNASRTIRQSSVNLHYLHTRISQIKTYRITDYLQNETSKKLYSILLKFKVLFAILLLAYEVTPRPSSLPDAALARRRVGTDASIIQRLVAITSATSRRARDVRREKCPIRACVY